MPDENALARARQEAQERAKKHAAEQAASAMVPTAGADGVTSTVDAGTAAEHTAITVKTDTLNSFTPITLVCKDLR